MPRTIPGNQARPDHIGFRRVTLDYAVDGTALNGAGKQITTLSKGAYLLFTQMITETVLAGGTPALKIGTTLGGVDVVASGAYASVATGVPTAPATAATFALPLAADTPIYAKDTGAATTSGKVTVVLAYCF
jgi:hypothetical protein